VIFRQFSGLRAREKRIVAGKGSVAPTMEFTYSLTGDCLSSRFARSRGFMVLDLKELTYGYSSFLPEQWLWQLPSVVEVNDVTQPSLYLLRPGLPAERLLRRHEQLYLLNRHYA